MKSIIKSNKILDEKEEYPCLKEIDSTIVLFVAFRKGSVVHIKDEKLTDNVIGTYCEFWIEKNFTPFTGILELSND